MTYSSRGPESSAEWRERDRGKERERERGGEEFQEKALGKLQR